MVNRIKKGGIINIPHLLVFRYLHFSAVINLWRRKLLSPYVFKKNLQVWWLKSEVFLDYIYTPKVWTNNEVLTALTYWSLYRFQVLPCALLAVLIHPSTSHNIVNRICWAFCVYLEAVSVLPQLRLMQNTKVYLKAQTLV